MGFIIKLLKLKITKIILSLLIITFIASFYFYKDWYIKQYHKCIGFYFVHKGDEAYKNTKYQKAVNYYKLALKHYPEHSKANCNLGNIYVSFENYYEAVNAYENALKYNPNFMVCRMDLGIILSEKMADYDKAIQEYGKVINTNPWMLINIPFLFNNKQTTHTNKGIAYYNMGLAYRGKAVYMGDNTAVSVKYLKKARDSYMNAIKYLKNDFDTYYNLALTNHLIGDYKSAGIQYCKAINIEPENFEAHYNMALLLRTVRLNEEALNEFEKAAMLIDSSLKDDKYKYIFGIMNEMKRRIINEGKFEYLSKRIDLTSLPPEEINYFHGKVILSKQKEFNKKEFFKCNYEKTLEEI